MKHVELYMYSTKDERPDGTYAISRLAHIIVIAPPSKKHILD